jgi:hypothetical protein
MVQACADIFVPSGTALMMAGESEDEWRKRITAALSEGTSHIVIDNVQRRLASASLAAALTVASWTDRILGRSEMTTLPSRAVWIATGNNMVLSDEISRRACWIRLNPRAEQPWRRTGFRHPRLLAWAKEHRAALVQAVLTLLFAWVAAGMPEWSGQPPGSYESWGLALGGILEVAGVRGFMGNAEELYEQLDPDRAAWRVFTEAWAERNGSDGVKASELLELHDQLDLELVPKGADASRVRKMGHALRKHVDRVYGDWMITRGGEHQRATLWSLQPAERYDGPRNSHAENA